MSRGFIRSVRGCFLEFARATSPVRRGDDHVTYALRTAKTWKACRTSKSTSKRFKDQEVPHIYCSTAQWRRGHARHCVLAQDNSSPRRDHATHAPSMLNGSFPVRVRVGVSFVKQESSAQFHFDQEVSLFVQPWMFSCHFRAL